MNTKRYRITVLFALALILVAAVGLASNMVGFSESSTFASVDVAVTSFSPVATCPGQDGNTYTLFHVTGSGPMTSTDPRLAGTFVADAYILDNPATGLGISKDVFRILDADGSVKVRGTVIAMDHSPDPIKGQVTARMSDGSFLYAMSTVTLPAPGTNNPIHIEYGGAGFAATDRAVIVNGGAPSPCVDPFISSAH